MAQPQHQPERLAFGHWRLSWLSAHEPHHLWVDGQLIAVTQQDHLELFTADNDEPPTLEVLSQSAVQAGELAQQQAYPSRVGWQWYWDGPAEGYFQIQQFEGGQWQSRAEPSNLGRGYYLWRSPPQPNDVESLWRVRLIDATGQVVQVLQRSVHIARPPQPPAIQVNLTYEPEPTLLIEAR
jgi:hypothetical protein